MEGTAAAAAPAVAVRAPARARGGAARGQARFFALCVTPSLAVLALVTLAPALYLLVASLTPLDLTRPETVGDFSRPLGNYAEMLGDRRLHNSVWVQAKLFFWTVGLQMSIGLGLALLLNLRSRLLEALRTVFLIPMVPALITDPDWALTAIVVADTWQWFPFTMLMILSALQMMPQEMVDAARVDGAGPWQMTRHVTLPFLRGVLLVAALFRLIDSIKAFPLIYILTDGGPGSVTEVTNYYSFQQAFNFSFLGYSAAITVALLAASVALSWAIVRVVGWGSHAE